MYNLSSSEKVATLIALSWGLAVTELTAVTSGIKFRPPKESVQEKMELLRQARSSTADDAKYSRLEEATRIMEGKYKDTMDKYRESCRTKDNNAKTHAKEAAKVIVGSKLQQDDDHSSPEIDLKLDQNRDKEVSDGTTTEGGETDSGSEPGSEPKELKELENNAWQPTVDSTPMPVVTSTENTPRGEEIQKSEGSEPQPSNGTKGESLKSEADNLEEIAEVIKSDPVVLEAHINSKTSTISNVPTVTNNLSPEKLNTASGSLTETPIIGKYQFDAAKFDQEHKAIQGRKPNLDKDDDSWFGSSFWSWFGCCCGDRGKTIS